MKYFKRLFVKNLLTALKNAGDIGVHLTEIETAVPLIRTQIRIRFHLISGSPGFDINRICKYLESDDRLVIDTSYYPLPVYYFTFSSKYSAQENIGKFCQAISRIVHSPATQPPPK